MSDGKQSKETVRHLRLWPEGAPGAIGNEPRDIPTLTVIQPKASGKTDFESLRAESTPRGAVVICPGGGYGRLAPHEAEPVAEWLNSLGIVGLLLNYRLGPRYRHPAPLADVQRAIRLARHHAADWNIDPQHIAVLGFSAGGHLASSAATLFNELQHPQTDEIDRLSARPDAAILIYPVITMSESHTHVGSRNNLLGESASPELLQKLSANLQVTAQTPPLFLLHGANDTPVPVLNSLSMALACGTAGVSYEMHILADAQHGFGMALGHPTASRWPQWCAEWLRQLGYTH